MKIKPLSLEKTYEIFDDNWTNITNSRYDSQELAEAYVTVLNLLERELKTVRGKVNEVTKNDL